MSPEKKVADEEGSPKKDSTKRHEEVTGNDNNHNEDDVASDISSNSSLGFEDDEDDGAKNKTGVNRIVPDYASDVSSDDLSLLNNINSTTTHHFPSVSIVITKESSKHGKQRRYKGISKE